MKMYDKKEKIKKWGNQIDPEVMAEDYLEHEDEQARQWAHENEEALQQMDRDTINLYRRHMNNSDSRNHETIVQKRKNRESTLTSQRGNLPNDPADRWIDCIYSKSPEDMYQLVSNEKLAEALKNLTTKQKRVVHMSIVKRMTSTEIAEKLKVSDRNVRDMLQRVYKNLREVLGDSRGCADSKTVQTLLVTMLLPTFVLGWHIANKIYPSIERVIKRR